MTTVWAVYFSGTGTTERTVTHIAGELARLLAAPCRSLDFTRPQVRQQELDFCQSDLVVLGTPVYAGRVPNVLLPFLREKIRGGGALAVPVVLFGNFYHSQCDTILYTSRRIKKLQFTDNRDGKLIFRTIIGKLHQRSIPDKIRQLFRYLNHNTYIYVFCKDTEENFYRIAVV